MIERAMGIAIRRMPTALGFMAVRTLAALPARLSIAEIEREALQTARKQRLGPNGRLRALTWGEGPAIALVHGWGGRATQMAPLACRLASAGYRAISFDVAGHGDSSEREARWDRFIRDISDIAEYAGPLSGFIGHSAGGLAMMASRGLSGVKADRFVCICTPFHPYPPIRAIQQRLNPGDSVLDRYRAFLGESFRTTWNALEAGAAWHGAGKELLLCYDENDRFVDHSDGDRAHALCRGSSLVKFSHYGHMRILYAEEVGAAICGFIKHSKSDH